MFTGADVNTLVRHAMKHLAIHFFGQRLALMNLLRAGLNSLNMGEA